jgi:hypothetical protein
MLGDYYFMWGRPKYCLTIGEIEKPLKKKKKKEYE